MGRYTIYEDWELDFIKENYMDMSYEAITNYLNLHNKVKKDNKQIRTKAAYMGLRKQDTGLKRDFFNVIDNEYKAYWLGFIYADGWVSKSETGSELAIELSLKDIEHLNKFKTCICSNSEIKTYHHHIKIANNEHFSDTETCKIRIYSNEIYFSLNRYGVTNRKTYDSNFPIVSNDLFRHVLRGYFDGDGCIYVQNNKLSGIHITAYNDVYLKYIMNQLDNMKISSKIYYENNRKSRLYIMKNFENKMKFLDLIYKNSNIYLDRKYLIYNGLAI